MRTHQIIPQTPTGYALNPKRGALSVVVPEATTNLITNPSFETGTDGWGRNPAGILGREIGGCRGAYRATVTPGSQAEAGFRYTFGASIALSGIYTLSFDVQAESGATVNAYVSGTLVAAVPGRGAGVWFRVECRPISVSSAGGAKIDIMRTTSSGGTADVLLLDGVQFEQKAYATTYVDGDQVGLVPGELAYFWDGAPHGSTSQRLATTNHGGRVVNFQSFGLMILSILGLGIVPPNLIAPRIPQGGAYFQRATMNPRTLTVVADISAGDEQALDQQRTLATRSFNPYAQATAQPLKLMYENYAADGVTPISRPAEILAHYSGGMDGSRTGLYQERVTPEFQLFVPLLMSPSTQSQNLPDQLSVASVNRILRRDRDGLWEIAGTGAASGSVEVLLQASDGTIYAGGAYSSMGGVANTLSIAKWSPVTETWTALDTGAASGAVYALAEAADGTIYAGGSFPAMGGVANTNLIAAYTPSTDTWASISSSASAGEVRAIVIGPGGQVYVAGTFTTLGGTAANRIIRYNPSGPNWAALSTGLNGAANALAVTNNATDVTVYVAGTFTTAGGVSAAKIAAWDGSSWSALGAGIDSVGDPYALYADQTGLLYIGGAFSSAGGTSAIGVATWNGTTYAQLGNGAGSGSTVYDIAADMRGNIYIAGTGLDFTPDMPDSMAIWNGSTFVPGDADTPGTALISAILPTRQGGLWLGFNTTGTATTANSTTVSNDGTAPTYPTFIINGPTSGAAPQVYQIVNMTTGAGVWFDFEVMVGETITLTLDPRSASYGLRSSLRGNVIDAILPGSNLADWFLRPGDNTVSVFSEGSSMTIFIIWREQYSAVEDLVLR